VDEPARERVFGVGRCHLVADVVFERPHLRLQLGLLQPGARDFALVPVEERKRRAEVEGVRAPANDAAFLAVILSGDGVVHFAVCELKAKIRDRSGAVGPQRLEIGPRVERQSPQLLVSRLQRGVPQFADGIDRITAGSSSHQQAQAVSSGA